ncbi:class D sortase [Candidatus Saccharibacteria bacterium]|nr:class D sortase [Candidatus Saccharibacteria bacterium]
MNIAEKLKLIFKNSLNKNIHSNINNGLTIIVLLLGTYLVAMPFWPQVSFATAKATGQLNNNKLLQNSADNSVKISSEYRLIIPQIGLDNLVYEGNSASVLQKGIWHRPKSSTPDKGHNTVLVAHRFTYNTPATFYHLDKLKVDDVVAVNYEGKQYQYKVRQIKTVEPSATEIEDDTKEPILTLYTCTPLWTAKQRLVVIADLIQSGES